MANELIGIDPSSIADLNRVSKKLVELGRADIADKATDKVAIYLRDVLKAYPVQKRVSRKSAYPETGNGFFTIRQQRYFFWALKNGRIRTPYRRTQNYARNWKIVGRGMNLILANESKYAGYLQDDTRQSRMARLIGWKTTSDILKQRQKRISEIIQGEVKRAIDQVF